jgi:hypothetical protein
VTSGDDEIRGIYEVVFSKLQKLDGLKILKNQLVVEAKRRSNSEIRIFSVQLMSDTPSGHGSRS